MDNKLSFNLNIILSDILLTFSHVIVVSLSIEHDVVKLNTKYGKCSK